VWALAILLGGVLPVAQMFGLEESSSWSLAASAVHLFEFVVMAILFAVAWRSRVPGSTGLLPAAGLSLALGLLVEIVQGPLPYRDFGIGDLAFDAAGIALGLLLLVVARRLREASGWSRRR
jgi:VanZ family protein